MFGFRKRRRERRETIKQAIDIVFDRNRNDFMSDKIGAYEFYINTFNNSWMDYKTAKVIVMLNTKK